MTEHQKQVKILRSKALTAVATYPIGAPEEQLGLSEINRSYSCTLTYANVTLLRPPVTVVLLLAVKSSVFEHSLLEPLKCFDSLELEPMEGEGASLLADDVCEIEPTEEPLRFEA
jgi:hypothetical protein